MNEINWITIAAIAIAVVQTLIAIIAVSVSWYIGRRQIQIMLQQATPTDKPPKKSIKIYLLLALCITLLSFTVLSVILHFIAFDLAPRLQSLTLMVNTLGVVFYIFVAGKIIKYIRVYEGKT